MSGMQSPAGRGAAGRTRSQAQGPPQVQPPQVPQQQQPPDIVQLQAQVQQLLTQVQNQNNTIANLQQQQAAAAPAPAPARFAVTPAAHATGFLDFDKKGDTVLFKEATKSLYHDPAERYNHGRVPLTERRQGGTPVACWIWEAQRRSPLVSSE